MQTLSGCTKPMQTLSGCTELTHTLSGSQIPCIPKEGMHNSCSNPRPCIRYKGALNSCAPWHTELEQTLSWCTEPMQTLFMKGTQNSCRLSGCTNLCTFMKGTQNSCRLSGCTNLCILYEGYTEFMKTIRVHRPVCTLWKIHRMYADLVMEYTNSCRPFGVVHRWNCAVRTHFLDTGRP